MINFNTDELFTIITILSRAPFADDLTKADYMFLRKIIKKFKIMLDDECGGI